ncbi:MAG: hypothetical protein B6I35_09670 [Anaerolineaceae bacterium 4572_32.2]|nr:MAG: hypothetical protein B6I35_09670 [Anaerolineaceae bacterium 4572_32.2]
MPLARVGYSDLTEYYAGLGQSTGGPHTFDEILSEPDTIILGAGYAEYMDLNVGDVVRVPGVGKDQQFPLWGKSQIVAAISQSRRALYAEKQTRFPNRGYKTGIAVPISLLRRSR